MRGTLDKRMIIARLVQSGPPKCAPLMRGSDPHELGRRASCIRRRALPAGAAGRPGAGWPAADRTPVAARPADGAPRSPEAPVPAAEPLRHQRRHDRLHGRAIHRPAGQIDRVGPAISRRFYQRLHRSAHALAHKGIGHDRADQLVGIVGQVVGATASKSMAATCNRQCWQVLPAMGILAVVYA